MTSLRPGRSRLASSKARSWCNVRFMDRIAPKAATVSSGALATRDGSAIGSSSMPSEMTLMPSLRKPWRTRSRRVVFQTAIPGRPRGRRKERGSGAEAAAGALRHGDHREAAQQAQIQRLGQIADEAEREHHLVKPDFAAEHVEEHNDRPASVEAGKERHRVNLVDDDVRPIFEVTPVVAPGREVNGITVTKPDDVKRLAVGSGDGAGKAPHHEFNLVAGSGEMRGQLFVYDLGAARLRMLAIFPGEPENFHGVAWRS